MCCVERSDVGSDTEYESYEEDEDQHIDRIQTTGQQHDQHMSSDHEQILLPR